MKRDAEGEDIGPCVRSFSPKLLRRHVRRATGEGEFDAQTRGRGAVLRTRAAKSRSRRKPRQTKIGYPRTTVSIDEHVVRFESARDDTRSVRGGETAACREEDLKHFPPWPAALPQPFGERPSFDQLHGQEHGVA